MIATELVFVNLQLFKKTLVATDKFRHHINRRYKFKDAWQKIQVGSAY